MTTSFVIGARRVGAAEPVFLVAEIGMNHNGDLDLACRMIAAAGACGADAVKFQSFNTDAFLSPAMPGLDERRRYEIPESWYPTLQAAAREAGVEFFSTPLDAASAETLARIGVPCFKIASCDLTNLTLIEQVAGYGRPMILSTGFASLGEIERAVAAAGRAGNEQVVLLHCVAVYPTPAEAANLAAIATLRAAFGLPVGLSDHSRDEPVIPVVAAALGAVAIEKHFTLDRALPGYDHGMSETPDGLTRLVAEVRKVRPALGHGRLQRSEAELARKATARRSLHWAACYEAGREITADMLVPLRPAHGMAPERLPELVGQRLARDVTGATPAAPEQVSWA